MIYDLFRVLTVDFNDCLIFDQFEKKGNVEIQEAIFVHTLAQQVKCYFAANPKQFEWLVQNDC